MVLHDSPPSHRLRALAGGAGLSGEAMTMTSRSEQPTERTLNSALGIRPRLIDLFCAQGGAGRGYQAAGFHVTGVDHLPQKRYAGDVFQQADAIEYVKTYGRSFEAVHASPPCQAFSALKNKRTGAKGHPDLIPAVREALRATGLPYVIENVIGAPLLDPLLLCGSMFDLKSKRGYLQRHRLFESNVLLMSPGPCRHEGLAIGVYGHGSGGLLGMRMRTANADEARELMGMDWATRDGMSQAIPPAYTEWIGAQLLRAVEQAA